MSRSLDTAALYGICAVLIVAFYYQFALGELPCPLCALQRVGFIVAGTALILNLRSGHAPAHYGLVLLTAVAAGAASLRQIALHVVPGSGSYGSALSASISTLGLSSATVRWFSMSVRCCCSTAGRQTPRATFG